MTTATKSRPILFSGAMVRAILEGRKTQTRRVVKRWPPKIRLPRDVRGDIPFAPNPVAPAGVYQPTSNPHGALCVETPDGQMLGVKPGELEWVGPFGQPGDELWVREAWRPWRDSSGDFIQCRADMTFIAADDDVQFACVRRPDDAERDEPRWRPSIFMPRWACRIELVVKDVRVERLQEISEEDARAEGAPAGDYEIDGAEDLYYESAFDGNNYDSARDALEAGWDALNAKRGFGWDVNPWVWVVEFERKEGAPHVG